jgi:hypothetical protein
MQPRRRTIDCIDVTAIIDVDIVGLNYGIANSCTVDLDTQFCRVLRRLRYEMPNLNGIEGVTNIYRSDTAVEVGQND